MNTIDIDVGGTFTDLVLNYEEQTIIKIQAVIKITFLFISPPFCIDHIRKPSRTIKRIRAFQSIDVNLRI